MMFQGKLLSVDPEITGIAAIGLYLYSSTGTGTALCSRVWRFCRSLGSGSTRVSYPTGCSLCDMNRNIGRGWGMGISLAEFCARTNVLEYGTRL